MDEKLCQICNKTYKATSTEINPVCPKCRHTYGIEDDYVYARGKFTQASKVHPLEKSRQAEVKATEIRQEQEIRNYYEYGEDVDENIPTPSVHTSRSHAKIVLIAICTSIVLLLAANDINMKALKSDPTATPGSLSSNSSSPSTPASNSSVTKITATYTGSQKAGTVIDNSCEDITVMATYSDGNIQEVYAYSVSDSVKLKAGNTSIVNISYGNLTYPLTIECNEQKTAIKKSEKQKDKKEKIKATVKKQIQEYSYVNVDSISINDDLGTTKKNNYVVLVYLTWEQSNQRKISRKVLAMYSEDLAAYVAHACKSVQEIAIFWTVPYLDGNAKISYERRSGEMHLSDKMFDDNFY